MSDPVVSPSVNPGRPKPRRWLRRLGIGAGSVLILFVAGYFVLTSGAFFKGVILPKVGQAMHATITVSDASISPFSHVILKDLKVQTTGTEPLVTAQEVRAQYSLWAILGGNLKVTEVTLNSPTVTVIKNPDGSSNLDPLKGSADSGASQKKTPAAGSSSPGGASPTGGSGGSGGAGSSRSAKPLQVDLSKVALNNATVRLITMPKEGGRQVVEVSKLNVALDNVKNGQTGKLTVAADLAFDSQPTAPADRASVQGKLETSGELSLGNDLSLSLVKIRSRASVTQAAGSLSEINGMAVSLDTDLSADPAKQSAVLRSFNLSGIRRDTTLLQTRQSGPVTIAWGGGAPAASDASLSVILTNLNLADWKGFTPGMELAGQAHGTIDLTAQESGKNIRINLAAFVDGLGAKISTNTVANLKVALSATAQAIGFKKVNVPEYRLALADPQASLVSVTGTLTADLPPDSADVEMRLEADLARLLALLPQNGLVLQSGQAQVNSKISRRNQALNDTGTLRIQKLTGKFGERPFQDLSLDSSYDIGVPKPQQIELRQLQLTLAPTDRARTNAATLSGSLNSSDPKAIEGALKLTADTLDLTSYYDLFEPASTDRPKSRPSGQHTPSSTPSTQKSPAPAPPPDTGPETEPPAMQLPVKLVTADIQIGRCYLRELILSKVTAGARVETNRITLNPISALLNDAPMTATVDLNVGVPGYQYDVSFKGDRLPLEPIANSFSPQYRGQAKGFILAAMNIKGEGITGPSLQKNLGGGLQLSFTNAEIQLVGAKAKALLTPIAIALGYPEIFKSPLRWLGADAKISQGKLQLSALNLVSPAFTAGTRGEIPFATKLAQSPIRDWPVDFALPRAIAERLKLAPKDGTATNEFVPLPNMVKAVGTLGNVETKVDAVALLQFGARTLTEIPGVGKDANKLLNQADSLLGGRLTGHTNASTNAAPTNSLPHKLGDLFKPKSK